MMPTLADRSQPVKGPHTATPHIAFVGSPLADRFSRNRVEAEAQDARSAQIRKIAAAPRTGGCSSSSATRS
jgi:hypothetical protein